MSVLVVQKKLAMRWVLFAATAALAGCAAPQNAPVAAPLGVNFTWQDTKGCFDPKPPAFTVEGAPAGTAFLRFRMTDLNAPEFDHGGGTIPYTGPQVPAGAFVYKGPCPPSGAHSYRWEVVALDAARSSVLAQGSKTLPYSQ